MSVSEIHCKDEGENLKGYFQFSFDPFKLYLSLIKPFSLHKVLM